ncbi:ATP-grasp domain-containing protein [Thermoactinospora rubra]|uniref:ATP-grasp domain-containing protein n=1 Tax=Thermoactinospora rubra TaxID=1088767 RepID=UPI000A105622|nr:hypothetical protein [Thermoactinospora rubra]
MTLCAYATYEGPDDEKELAIEAWGEVGIEGRAVRWDDPDADWSAFDAVVVRSTWDYVDRREEFLDWTRRVSAVTRLLNPADVIAANTDKTYLRTLEVPIVPTHWSSTDLPDWPEYVVKPTVSAGARDTVRTADRQAAAAHAARLEASGRTPMVQPYLAMVEDEGETSLLYFNGRLSHTVRRTPMLAHGETKRDNRLAQLRDPAPDQVELAEKVLAAIPRALLYARVDLVRLPDGTPAVIELELTEPYLYLREGAAAGDFARALSELI